MRRFTSAVLNCPIFYSHLIRFVSIFVSHTKKSVESYRVTSKLACILQNRAFLSDSSQSLSDSSKRITWKMEVLLNVLCVIWSDEMAAVCKWEKDIGALHAAGLCNVVFVLVFLATFGDAQKSQLFWQIVRVHSRSNVSMALGSIFVWLRWCSVPDNCIVLWIRAIEMYTAVSRFCVCTHFSSCEFTFAVIANLWYTSGDLMVATTNIVISIGLKA